MVIVRHPEFTSNLLKPIRESNIITQELETVEKSNIFDIESAASKNCYQSSKPTKLKFKKNPKKKNQLYKLILLVIIP